MLIRPAEESFQKGMEALSMGRRLEALALFESAIALERQFGSGRPQPRYLSYYGMCLAREARKLGHGTELSRVAGNAEFYNPDLYCNLAKVLGAASRRREAYQVLLRGLKWERSHAGIVRELRSMGRRRKPVLPFLSRTNPLNVLLGRMTYVPRQQTSVQAA